MSYRVLSIFFLSPLSLRRATSCNANVNFTTCISIHALLAESDLTVFSRSLEGHNFYPRSPCGERPVMNNIIFMPREFLSTLSLRRATEILLPCLAIHNFYPRSPCGERQAVAAAQHHKKEISIHALLAESDVLEVIGAPFEDISIHALLAESDAAMRPTKARQPTFLSTLSLRRATYFVGKKKTQDKISIHALLAESD